ncbi:hypothetical protein RRG08_022284 [Elysia crispata]|uniref:Uncharacterized protein n=1 Tax=Elysia crispata TaxID=231223 RepID=A0AAE0ZQ81_9GAST|nr:hypothetical protein RRG08_022284 [Elysia crispata]
MVNSILEEIWPTALHVRQSSPAQLQNQEAEIGTALPRACSLKRTQGCYREGYTPTSVRLLQCSLENVPLRPRWRKAIIATVHHDHHMKPRADIFTTRDSQDGSARHLETMVRPGGANYDGDAEIGTAMLSDRPPPSCGKFREER